MANKTKRGGKKAAVAGAIRTYCITATVCAAQVV